MRKQAVFAVSALVIAVIGVGAVTRGRQVLRPALAPECSPGDGGITLPPGFCASIYADTVGVARHLLVAPNGDVLVSVGDADAAGTTRMRGDKRHGAIVALRDTNHDGRADLQVRTPMGNGTGLALSGGYLYFTNPTTVMRVPWSAASLGVRGDYETVIDGFPGRPGHGSVSLAIDDRGNLYVGVGSRGNVCMSGQIALDPCPQLEQRAGIWRYPAGKIGQRHPLNGELMATGVRNPVAITWSRELDGLYALSHGRDALHQNFPKLYSSDAGAENPAEEFARISAGDDWGWPYCYYDLSAKQKLLAPEYGGDAKTPGRCATATKPLVAFPGHWAPDGVLIYSGTMFPPSYRGGAFVAFHGSWNRSPRPEAGYDVVFAPFANGKPTGSYAVFADGFAGRRVNPGGAEHRPVGLAQGLNGELFVSDDQSGRIWRIVYVGTAKRPDPR
jgi:glucose/arabinose dehydrogenase